MNGALQRGNVETGIGEEDQLLLWRLRVNLPEGIEREPILVAAVVDPDGARRPVSKCETADGWRSAFSASSA